MKIFDTSRPLPKYLQMHSKIHEIIMFVLTFIVVPIASILVITHACTSVGLRVVQTTASKLAWHNGKFPEVYVWGIMNVALYTYLFIINLDSHQYSKPAKITFYVILGIAAGLLLGGFCVPLPLEYAENIQLHKLHNNLVTAGFSLFVAVQGLMCITTFFRNIKQALIFAGWTCFFIATGVWAIPQVNAPDSHAFITVSIQMYVFAMMEIYFFLNYCFGKLYSYNPPFKRKSEQNSTAE